MERLIGDRRLPEAEAAAALDLLSSPPVEVLNPMASGETNAELACSLLSAPGA